MNKQQLSEALDPGSRTYGWLTVLEEAARLVERLLPGECPLAADEPDEGPSCQFCHGSGQVWDEGIVETVAKAIFDDNSMYKKPDQLARAVLSALVELLTEKVER